MCGDTSFMAASRDPFGHPIEPQSARSSGSIGAFPLSFGLSSADDPRRQWWSYAREVARAVHHQTTSDPWRNLSVPALTSLTIGEALCRTQGSLCCAVGVRERGGDLAQIGQSGQGEFPQQTPICTLDALTSDPGMPPARAGELDSVRLARGICNPSFGLKYRRGN